MTALALFLLGGSAARSAPRKLLWPLNIRISPTSSFCEYRPLRYHAGLDFSTGGRTGVPVIAVADGYVWRVRVSPYGYGKVIYLRLADGRTTVYAHLSRFIDQLEKLVRRDQMEREAYTVDLFLTPGQVSVRRGQVIAWSGKTGIGVPHLHFEIRDAQNRPLNPLANGLELSDTIPPTMGSLAFMPLDADSRVNERLKPYLVPLANYGGVWTSRRVPLLWGRIGVALMVWDRTPHSRYRLSVHGMTMSVNGREVFRRDYDRLSLVNQQLSVFDRNFQLIAGGSGRYYNMFLPPGDALRFYGGLPTGAGILVCGDGSLGGNETFLSPGEHELTFTATDFSGTPSQGKIAIVVGRGPQIERFVLADSSNALRLRVVARDSTGGVRVSVTTKKEGEKRWGLLAAVPPDTLPPPPHVNLRTVIPDDSLLLRVVVRDTFGHRVTDVVRLRDRGAPPRVELKQAWGRNWLRVDLRSSRPLPTLPVVRASWPEKVVVRLEPTEISPGLYETTVVPDSSWPKRYKVRVLAGMGRPTVVSQWIGEREIPGVTEVVPERDTLTAHYRGVVEFHRAFPDSGFVRITAGRLDTALIVRGKVLGPFGGSFSRPDLGATVEFGRGVLPEPMFVRIESDSLRSFPELEPVGPAYRVEPQEYPLAGDATIIVRLPDTLDLDGVALYGVSRRKASCLAVPEESFDHTIRARVPSLYTVGVYRDTTPPRVRITSPRRRMIVRVRRPLIVATVRDDGAGFAKRDDAMEMRLDGSWVPAAYDPEENTLTYRPPASLPTGRHTVEVHAQDQVGNEASASLRFTVE